LSQFDTDRRVVIARAAENGLTHMINPGMDVPSSQAAVELAQKHASVYAAVGVHPHDAKTLDAAGLEHLKSLAQSYKVVAIGEIGLDYYRNLSPRNVQRQVFQTQLELAAELGLPVIVHDREAHDDALAMLRDWALDASRSTLHDKAGVLHSFSGDVALAESVLALGFYIGVSGPVTYKNANRLREVVQAVPLERLLIETDAPYLAPHPYRGQRNEPVYVQRVAQAIAEIKHLALEQVATLTSTNACMLFGLAG
jgi:TatD DNase family protein